MTDEDTATITVENDFRAINEKLYKRGATDGLPVYPPTRDRVDEMLGGTDRPADDVVGVIPPKYGNASVEKIAINAVMAGCEPEYMPVLTAAVEAMTEDPFNLYGINATTHPVAPLIVVNGPIVEDLNLNYGYNVFGQGWKANSTIGRAVRLLLMNVGGGQPGEMDRATHGQPGKFSFCIAENERKSPWDPFHVSRGFDEDESTVTAMAVEAPHEINDHVSQSADGVLTVTSDVLATIGNNNCLGRGEIAVVVGPEHADTIERDGYTREEVQRYLYDHARNKMSKIRQAGMYQMSESLDRFDVANDDALIPLVHEPSDIHVIVAGGAGKHSMALHSFGETYAQTKKVTQP
jgi:hypothetical protein